jgi:hypothetical protein
MAGDNIPKLQGTGQITGANGAGGVNQPPSWQDFRATLSGYLTSDIQAIIGAMQTQLKGSPTKEKAAGHVLAEFKTALSMVRHLGDDIDSSIGPTLGPVVTQEMINNNPALKGLPIGHPIELYGVVFITAVQRLINSVNAQLQAIADFMKSAANIPDEVRLDFEAQQKELTKITGQLNRIQDIAVAHTSGWGKNAARNFVNG